MVMLKRVETRHSALTNGYSGPALLTCGKWREDMLTTGKSRPTKGMDGARDGTCAQMVLDFSMILGRNGRLYILDLKTAPGQPLHLAP